MANPTASSRLPRDEAQLGGGSAIDTAGQVHRLADDVGRFSIGSTQPTSTNMSSGSSSSVPSPSSRHQTVPSIDAAAAASKGSSAMPSRMANQSSFYSGSSSSPMDDRSSDDLPSSMSFGPSTTEGFGSSMSRRGHTSYPGDAATLAHKDSFGGLQGIQRAPQDHGAEGAPWYGAGTQANLRQDFLPRRGQDSEGHVVADALRGSVGYDTGAEVFEDADGEEGPASPTSPNSEPVEIMGSISGGRGFSMRNGSMNTASRGAAASGHHPARAASLSAAAAATLSTSSSSSGYFGSSTPSDSSPTMRSGMPGSFNVADNANRTMPRSQSLATSVGASTMQDSQDRVGPSASLSTALAQGFNGASKSDQLSVSPMSQADRLHEAAVPSSRATVTMESEPARAAKPSSSSSRPSAEGPDARPVRPARQQAPTTTKADAAGTRPKPSLRPDPPSRTGSDSKSATGTSSRERSNRDKERSGTGNNTASSRNSGSSTQASQSTARGEAAGPSSRSSSKPTSRMLPQLPSTPNMKPAPPPAMYWSKAPIHGSIPRRCFRAHTANLCDEVLWLFGGCDNKGCFRDLFCFDTETMCWSKPKVTGDVPPARRAHTATMVNQRLFVFAGGDGPNYFNDLYVFDTVSLRWTKPEVYGTPPSPRRAHTCNYHEGQLIVFGGGNGVGALNDVHTLDVHDPSRLEWRKLECKGKIPIGRGYHTTNLVDGKLIVIGGSDGHMSFNDIHILRLDTRTWYQVKTDEIHNRLGHTATQVGSYLFIFAGHDSKTYTDELLTLNLVNLQWEPRRVCGSKPPGRGYHQAWLRDSRLFVHGGFDGKDIFDDLYFLDLAACAYLPQITSFSVELDDD